jgi:hypothetical protein
MSRSFFNGAYWLLLLSKVISALAGSQRAIRILNVYAMSETGNRCAILTNGQTSHSGTAPATVNKKVYESHCAIADFSVHGKV